MADTEEISLRPSFRPGGAGGNVFARFGKGAGGGIKNLSKTVASTEDDKPKKSPEEIIRYNKDFLMKFMEHYNKCPLELQQLNLEVVLTADEERDQQRQLLQRVKDEEADERDWRARAPVSGSDAKSWPSSSGGGQQEVRTTQANQAAAKPEAKELPKIQKAEDVGRTAYRVGAAIDTTERAYKAIKGILNKLTPEKFDRLLAQLLELITTAALLKSAISMLFENAVAQPTFCAMYAELALQLSKGLPVFSPPEGETKPVSFKRILLNQCQDEFEGAASAMKDLKEAGDPEERAAEERKVKMRMIGTVRLISELYMKEVIKDSIVTVCIRELLTASDKSNVPEEDNIEAACEMITIVGRQLHKSEKGAKELPGYMARLERLSTEKKLSSRVRFLIKDVLDMKKNNWVARRETFTAKKLDEVRAQAEAELGLVSSAIKDVLPALPVQQKLAKDEAELFPGFKEDDGGWAMVGKKGTKSFGKGGSALLGDYKPPPAVSRPAAGAKPPTSAAPAAPAAEAAAPSAKKSADKPLTEEEVSSKAKSMFREYVSVADKKEALLCMQELSQAEHHVAVVEVGLAELMDVTSDRAKKLLGDLIVSFVKEGQLQEAKVLEALGNVTKTLEDLALDVPTAPKVLGSFYAALVTEADTKLDHLKELIGAVEGAEPRRGFCQAVFNAVKVKVGDDKLTEMCKAGGIQGGELLKHDEMDGDLPEVQDWLEQEKLTAVPL